jgi:hypothetical protein
MESNNWVFGQTWPWRVITGCLVRLKSDKTPNLLLSKVKFDKTPSYYSPCSSLTKHPVITLHGQVWQNTQLLLSMVKSDQTPSYYFPWSSLTKHPVITLRVINWVFCQTWSWRVISWVFCQTWPGRVISWVFGQTWPWRVITGCFVRLDQQPVITLHGKVWPNTQLLLSLVKSDQTSSYYSPWSSLTKHQAYYSPWSSLSVLSGLTRDSHKLGVWSDLTMESNNWVFGQTWPWRVIAGCLVRLDHGE